MTTSGATQLLTRPREAELLRVATRLFRTRGFHATSMQDLAEALGMNRGSLYHYIESKDDLLWWIVSGTLDRLHDRVCPALSGSEPGAVRLRRAMAEHLSFAAEHGDELSLVQIELRSLAADRRRQIVDRRDAYQHLWRGAIEGAAPEGALPPTNTPPAGRPNPPALYRFTLRYRP